MQFFHVTSNTLFAMYQPVQLQPSSSSVQLHYTTAAAASAGNWVR
jgi:hypothetical protein